MTSLNITPLSDYDYESSVASCFEPPYLQNIASESMRRFIFTAYATVSILSFIGNVIVIVVQKCGSRSTNGLRTYVINLAISDIINAVMCVPFNYSNVVLGHWDYPHWMCPTVQFIQLLGVFVTSVTLSIIAVERHLAVVYSTGDTTRWMKHNKKWIILFTWIIGIAYSSTLLNNTYTVAFHVEETIYHECKFDNDLSEWKRLVFSVLNLVITFLIPIVLMAFSYAAIVRRMTMVNQNRLNLPRNYCTLHDKRRCYSLDCTHAVALRHNRRNINLDNRKRITRMMMVVIFAFCICWFPIKFLQFITTNVSISLCAEWQYYGLMTLYLFFHWLAMANSMVNVVIYSFMSNNFRSDLMTIFLMLKNRIRGHRDVVHQLNPLQHPARLQRQAPVRRHVPLQRQDQVRRPTIRYPPVQRQPLQRQAPVRRSTMHNPPLQRHIQPIAHIEAIHWRPANGRNLQWF